MAAEYRFVYRIGGRDVIPNEATHVSMHESVKVIPAKLFEDHKNIAELICHFGVERIENHAFRGSSLKRIIIPGVRVVGIEAFGDCKAVYIECIRLERIGNGAFREILIPSISLPSAITVGAHAFYRCEVLTEATFGKHLESIDNDAFGRCRSLERITIPLKDGIIAHDGAFKESRNLKRVDLLEGDKLHETVSGLLLDEWKQNMNRELDSINQILPDAHAGDWCYVTGYGEKAIEIRNWIARVLRRIVHYKSQHRGLLNVATSALSHALPYDIVTNSVLPFLELPLYTFEGEVEEEENISNSDNRSEYACEGQGGDGDVDEDDSHDELHYASAGGESHEEQQQQDDGGGRKRRKTANGIG